MTNDPTSYTESERHLLTALAQHKAHIRELTAELAARDKRLADIADLAVIGADWVASETDFERFLDILAIAKGEREP